MGRQLESLFGSQLPFLVAQEEHEAGFEVVASPELSAKRGKVHALPTHEAGLF